MHPSLQRALLIPLDLAAILAAFAAIGLAWLAIHAGASVARSRVRESRRGRSHRGHAAWPEPAPIGRCPRCGLVHETRAGRLFCREMRGAGAGR